MDKSNKTQINLAKRNFLKQIPFFFFGGIAVSTLGQNIFSTFIIIVVPAPICRVTPTPRWISPNLVNATSPEVVSELIYIELIPRIIMCTDKYSNIFT